MLSGSGDDWLECWLVMRLTRVAMSVVSLSSKVLVAVVKVDNRLKLVLHGEVFIRFVFFFR